MIELAGDSRLLEQAAEQFVGEAPVVVAARQRPLQGVGVPWNLAQRGDHGLVQVRWFRQLFLALRRWMEVCPVARTEGALGSCCSISSPIRRVRLEQSARQNCRLPYSRASFERVPHLVGELWLEHHADIEGELIKMFEIPTEAASISVAIDRASVPIEEDVQGPPGRPRKNAPKRSMRRVFHMCYCATATLHDEDGHALHTLRRGQMPGRDPQDISNLLANDVLVLRDKLPDLRPVLLADGAAETWNLLETKFPTSVFGSVHCCIDFWHVVEKLAAAAKVLATNADAAKVMVWAWSHQSRRRKDAADMIRAELVAPGRDDVLVDGERPVHDAITYLANNAARMNHAGAIAKGRPVGSGNVEATCKTLVGLRMKRCGSRWRSDTGNPILHLRALAISDRWDEAMVNLFPTQPTSVRTRVRETARRAQCQIQARAGWLTARRCRSR